MYRDLYAEVLADDQGQARRSEVRALGDVIGKLVSANERRHDLRALDEALDAMELLWSVFLADVASPGNALPQDVRRNVVALAQAMFSRSAELRGKGGDLGLLIDVNTAVRDGLAGR